MELVRCWLWAASAVAVAAPPEATCADVMSQARTPSTYASDLQAEVKAYITSAKYQNKINELLGTRHVDWDHGRIGEISSALRGLIDSSVHSILDLGAGPGLISRHAQQLAARVHGSGGAVRVVGVELVAGWVRTAQEFAASRPIAGTSFHFHLGDITNISLGHTFDVLYMADSIEHVPTFRRPALWQTLMAHSHSSSRLYLHYPNLIKQMEEQGVGVRGKPRREVRIQGGSGRRLAQHFEIPVELSVLVKQAKCAGFTMTHSEDHGKGQSGYMSVYFTRQ